MKKKNNLRTYPGDPGAVNGGDSSPPSTGVMEDHTETVCSYLPDGTMVHVNEVFFRFFGVEPKDVIGKSTAGSIHSGVVVGVLNEIDGFIERFSNGAENFIIILTGGDTDFLANRLKNTIFANPIFLLESLEKIFIQNKK